MPPGTFYNLQKIKLRLEYSYHKNHFYNANQNKQTKSGFQSPQFHLTRSPTVRSKASKL